MTVAGINIDIPATMKEVRQTGFPIVLVGFMGLGGHHWATRYFDEVIVLESRAKIVLVEGVSATNAENAKQLARIAQVLDRMAPQRQAGIFDKIGGLAAAAIVDGAEGQGHHGAKPKIEPNAARFDFGEHGECPE